MSFSQRLLPHPQYERLYRAMLEAQLLATPWEGHFFRACGAAHAKSGDLVTGDGSFVNGGRWNGPLTCHTVYGTFTPEAAVSESLANFRRAGISAMDATPLVVASVKGCVRRLDLTKAAVLEVLGLSAQRLGRDSWWKSQGDGKESLTQAIGRAAFAAEIEGLEVRSAAVPGAHNLAIFVERLPTGRRLEAKGLGGAL